MLGIIAMLAGIIILLIYYAVMFYLAISERFNKLEDKISKLEYCVNQQMIDELESNSIIFERLYNLESEKNKVVQLSNN